MSIDLLRPALRPPRPRPTLSEGLIAVESMVTLLAFAVLAAVLVQSLDVGRTLAMLERDVAAARQQWEPVGQRQRETQRTRREVRELQTLMREPPWGDLLETLRRSLSPGMWLVRVVAQASGEFEVTLRARDTALIPEFVQRLQAVRGVYEVRLETTETTRVGEEDVGQATIVCRVGKP